MASNRFTIASNANRSIKAPLIVPASTATDPKASNSIRNLVLKTAQTKLRLKKGTRIFTLTDGSEIQTDDDWKNLPVDATLLVSTGEDYIGAKKADIVPGPGHDEINLECPVKVLADVTSVDKTSITQLETTARTLPGMVAAFGQPDIHPGTKFPIGAVFVSKNWIHPPLIGSDIGCGMSWYMTNLTRRNLEKDKAKRITDRLQGLEGPWRTSRERQNWLSTGEDGDYSAGDQWDSSIGTIGAGNHFAELQIVEHAVSDVSLPTDSVLLLVHSGSRGYGTDILHRYTKQPSDKPSDQDESASTPEPSTSSLPASSTRAAEYLTEHDKARRWASLNRDLIALRFLSVLEPQDPAWAFEGGAEDTSTYTDVEVRAATQATKAAISARRVVDICHNSVERVANWPPASATVPSAEPQNDEAYYIHRKGAAPSVVNSAVVPLPGSRGTATLILRPKPETSGAETGMSIAHGAGRAMSRAKAAVWVAQKYKGRTEALIRGDEKGMGAIGSGNVVGAEITGGRRKVSGKLRELMRKVGALDSDNLEGGTWVVCDEKVLVWEEAAEAYKNVWEVGVDSEAGGAAEVVGWTKGRISYKIRKEH